MEVGAWWDWLEAAPATNDAFSYHANPDLAFCLKLFAVPSLGFGASRFVVGACVFGAVARCRYMGASTSGADLERLGHQTVTVSYSM
jgi:hypothetical protein